jgi:hypothetical protein
MPLDERMTNARRGYVEEYERLKKFYAFITDAPVIAEQYATGELPHSFGRNPLGSQAPPFDRRVKPGMGAYDELWSHAPMIFQLCFSRAVDNYTVYMASLLAEVFTHRPEVLRNSEKVLVEDVLAHPTMQAFVAALAERRVNSLVNEGTAKLADYVSKYANFKLFDSPERLELMIEVGAVRNVIAHNRGIVDSRFLKRVPRSKWPIGEAVPLTDHYLWKTLTTLDASVNDIDQRAVEKFSLPVTSG